MSLAHHFGSLGSCYRELEVGVLFPITKEEGKFREEAIVDIAHGGNGLGAGVAIDPSFE